MVENMTIIGDITLMDLGAVLLIFIAATVVSKALSLYARKRLRDNLGDFRIQVMVKVIKIVVFFLALIMVFPLVGVDPSGLLVAGGILAIVLGFASQSIVGNLISGLFLLIERPMKIGDVVEINGNYGTVEDIRILATIIRKFDGYMVRIPNQTVFTTDIKNFQDMRARRFDYVVGIRYSDDATKAKEVIYDLLGRQPFVLVNPPPKVYVDNLGDNSVNLSIKVWSPVSEWWDLRMELLQKIKEELEANGIEVPFPQRTVWFPNGINVEQAEPVKED